MCGSSKRRQKMAQADGETVVEKQVQGRRKGRRICRRRRSLNDDENGNDVWIAFRTSLTSPVLPL